MNSATETLEAGLLPTSARVLGSAAVPGEGVAGGAVAVAESVLGMAVGVGVESIVSAFVAAGAMVVVVETLM